MVNVVALIPARSGSKGLLHKNMQLLGGHSLIEWAVAASKHSVMINSVYLSTDSIEYAEHGVSLGAIVPSLRPAELSADQSNDIEFVTHALDNFFPADGQPDLIVHLRPTTPLRCPEVIDRAITSFLNVPEATALRSVHRMSESAYKCFERGHDQRLMLLGNNSYDVDSANAARQSFPDTFTANGYVDILSVENIKKTNLLHGSYVIGFETENTIEVDTKDDLDLLKFKLLANQSYANIFS